MIVTAMLAWYDEPCSLLSEAVASAAVIADRIVVADGAYELVEDKASASPPNQRRAIREAAAAAGLACEFLKPRLWGGQVEKRNAIIQRAAEGSDWVFPLDADWLIHGERDAIRAELVACEAEQVYVNFEQPLNPRRSLEESASGEWHREYAGTSTPIPLLMRVLADMRVERAHWVYSGERADGTRVGFWGGATLYEQATTESLNAPHLFEHRCLFRDPKQILRNRYFCEARDLETAAHGGIEA